MREATSVDAAVLSFINPVPIVSMDAVNVALKWSRPFAELH